MLPLKTQEDTISELRNWDLWGPLLLCMVLSVVMSLNAPTNQASLLFALVFFVVWVGAAVVTLNAQLLGGTVSFFQSVCVLGYCIFPLVVASILTTFWHNAIFKLIVVSAGFVWSTRASVVFISQLVAEDRQFLSAYPTFLFYIFISWMILVS